MVTVNVKTFVFLYSHEHKYLSKGLEGNISYVTKTRLKWQSIPFVYREWLFLHDINEILHMEAVCEIAAISNRCQYLKIGQKFIIFFFIDKSVFHINHLRKYHCLMTGHQTIFITTDVEYFVHQSVELLSKITLFCLRRHFDPARICWYQIKSDTKYWLLRRFKRKQHTKMRRKNEFIKIVHKQKM